MRLFITGGTGFVGSALCRSLVARGDELTLVSRKVETAQQRVGVPVTAVPSVADICAKPVDAVINLAGVPIADRRWSEDRKRELYASRIDLTNQLIDALAQQQQQHRPKVLVSASAVGYYGDCGSRELDEDSRPQQEFTHELCAAWEQAALRAEDLGIRVCIVRIGLVLGPGGGILKRMLTPFRLGLGGRLGSGEQWMSWVHRDDLVRITLYLLDHDTLRGVFNGTAPAPLRNRDFSLVLARQLGRPAALPVPATVLKLGLGEMSRLLLTGQRVIPRRLLDAGFEFHYPEFKAALEHIIP
jgi:uncharacterized protein (TIGR01777 family)